MTKQTMLPFSGSDPSSGREAARSTGGVRAEIEALDTSYERGAVGALMLATIEQLGPSRLRWLGSNDESILDVVDGVRSGHLPLDLGPPPVGVTGAGVKEWGAQLRALDIANLVARHQDAGVELLMASHPLWPFHDDPEPPLMLMGFGRTSALAQRPRVAIVGTRTCTAHGQRVARMLGADLTAAGVSVISGLATGVDAAAHQGAFDAIGGVAASVVVEAGALPIGVVASGLDVIYPRRNAAVWAQVKEQGLLLSEAPLGMRPRRWRFPARNRIVAALADVVVVVESHVKGGSMHTVEAAMVRGKTVMAVPGSILNEAAAGTNRLLRDGCAPVTEAQDVLDVLAAEGLEAVGNQNGGIQGVSGSKITNVKAGSGRGDRASSLDPLSARIFREAEGGGLHIDDLVALLGAPIPEILVAVESLVGEGLIRLDGSTVLPANRK